MSQFMTFQTKIYRNKLRAVYRDHTWDMILEGKSSDDAPVAQEQITMTKNAKDYELRVDRHLRAAGARKTLKTSCSEREKRTSRRHIAACERHD